MLSNKFSKIIDAQFSFLKDKKLLLAISGGVDSVVLAHLCKEAELNFAMAHCNFNLRDKESDADEIFVRNLAESMKVKLHVKSFETLQIAREEGKSTQLMARDLRYPWFDELSETLHCDFILTAHHLNDDVETFMINFLRGTGLQGLTGIPPVNHKVIRPLLDVSRDEIVAFARQRQIAWREDASNWSDDYLRNRIRHHIIPIFESENPGFLHSFIKTRRHLNQASLLLKEYTKLLEKEMVSHREAYIYFDKEKIKNHPDSAAVLYQLLHKYGFTAWEDIGALLDAQPGKQVFAPRYKLLKDRNHLVLSCKDDVRKELGEITIPENQKITNFTRGKILCEKVVKLGKHDNFKAYLAADKLVFPLKLRVWRPGDTFQPFGMKGNKKVSDFLRDEKIPLFEKEKTMVLLSGEDIVWVVGHRISEAFKITDGLNDILKIEWIR